MMISSNLPLISYSGSAWLNSDVNAKLTSSDEKLVEFAGGSNDLSSAETYNPEAGLLARKIGADRQNGTLTGDVNQGYIDNLLQESHAHPSANLPAAILYKAESYFNPPTNLPKGEFYVNGMPAYFGNDMLTDSDKKVVEAVGGSPDLLIAERNPDVGLFAGAVASDRSLGLLKGTMGADYVENLVQQQQDIQGEIRSGSQRGPSGNLNSVATINLSVLDNALAYLGKENKISINA
jgi:hypothetical protein